MTSYVSIKEDVFAKLKENLPEIRERFFVDIIGIFGSVSRGEDTAESDVDVLYTFSEGKGSYDTFLDLADYLENLFQRKVDVVSLTYLSPPHVKPYVEPEMILFGSSEAASV